MNKLCLIASLGMGLCAINAQAGFDGHITLNSGPNQFNNGGEFTATGITPVNGPLGSTFQTFCIEYTENLRFGSQYEYKINSGAVKGGAGNTAVDPYTGLSMDNVSIGTAWLYSQFRAGTLANYFGADQLKRAGDLQMAIWYLEDETSSLTGTTFNGYTPDGSVYYNLAKANAGGGSLSDTQVKADSGGAYGVVALNLFSAGSPGAVTIDGQTYDVNQDVLAIVPEPTTMVAGALLLLPFGASALRIVRRKI